MAKTVIDIDTDNLRDAAAELGTTTKKDTVNAALAEIAARARRRRATERMAELAADGAFDKLLEPDFEKEAWH